MRPAHNPAIDGRRVVFEDERDGPSRIYAIELPDLFVLGARSVREGRLLQLAVLGRDPTSDAPMRLSARLADGTPVERLGMRFLQHPKRALALLSWRPGLEAAGRYALRFEGETGGGLVTRETVEIRIDDAKPPVHR